MAAAPGCDCAIVSGQSSPNNHSRHLLCATFRLLMRIQSAFEQTGIRYLDDDSGSSIGVRINAPHPIPPKAANVPVLAVYPDNRQNAAKVRARVDVFARRLC